MHSSDRADVPLVTQVERSRPVYVQDRFPDAYPRSPGLLDEFFRLGDAFIGDCNSEVLLLDV